MADGIGIFDTFCHSRPPMQMALTMASLSVKALHDEAHTLEHERRLHETKIIPQNASKKAPRAHMKSMALPAVHELSPPPLIP
jgi:hypothetical protein